MSNPNPLETITEGWTTPIPFQLLLNNAAFDAEGMTVTAIIRDKFGHVVPVATAWATQASAIAEITPPDDPPFRAVKSPYQIRFQLTDEAGQVAFFPPGAPDHFAVVAP